MRNGFLSKTAGGAYFDMLKTSYYNTDGELLGLIGVGRNISERKQAEDERRKLEERLQRAEKMEALGLWPEAWPTISTMFWVLSWAILNCL